MDRNVQKIEAKKPLVPKRKRVCAYARVSSGKDAMLHSISAQVSYYMELNRPQPQMRRIYKSDKGQGSNRGFR